MRILAGPSAQAAALRPRDLLAALLVVTVWGLNFVAMKWGLRSFTPFQMGAARYLLAALPLVFLLRPPHVPWHWVAVFGLCQGLGQFGFLFTGLRLGVTSGLASVLLQTQVFFTALLAFSLLGERPGLPLRWGMALAALGLAYLVMNEWPPVHGAGTAAATTTGLGLLLTLCGAMMWAASNIMARLSQHHYPGYHPVAFVAWSSLASVLPFMALSAWADPAPERWLQWQTLVDVPIQAWAAVAYQAWAATIVGYALWTSLLQRYPANRVAPFSLGVPVVGLTAGALLLSETVAPWQWGGIALVAAALLCVVLGPTLQAKYASNR